MEGAQTENFEFYRTLNGCAICFNLIPKEYIKKVIHVRDKAEIYAKVRKEKVYLDSNGYRERYLAKRNSLRDPTSSSTNKVQLNSNKEDPEPRANKKH